MTASCIVLVNRVGIGYGKTRKQLSMLFATECCITESKKIKQAATRSAAIGFSFKSDWLRKLTECSEPITAKRN